MTRELQKSRTKLQKLHAGLESDFGPGGVSTVQSAMAEHAREVAHAQQQPSHEQEEVLAG